MVALGQTELPVIKWYETCATDEQCIIAYSGFSDDVLLRMEVREVGYSNVGVILLNARVLSDDEFKWQIECHIRREWSDLIEQAKEVGGGLETLLLSFLSKSIEFGHVDPRKDFTLRMADIAEEDTWKLSRLWGEILLDLEDYILEQCPEKYCLEATIGMLRAVAEEAGMDEAALSNWLWETFEIESPDKIPDLETGNKVLVRLRDYIAEPEGQNL